MVKGKTKSGIKFQINERIKDDARFVIFYAKAQDKNATQEEQADAMMRFLRLIFGSDEGTFQFMDAVASAHGGVCDKDALEIELSEMLEALNAKNSSSSPQ